MAESLSVSLRDHQTSLGSYFMNNIDCSIAAGVTETLECLGAINAWCDQL